MNLTVAAEARALYEDGFSPSWISEEDDFWIQTVYAVEAYRNGEPLLTLEEARRADEALKRCVRGLGFTYSTSCLRKAVRKEFGPFRNENLRESQNPALLGSLLSRTSDNPSLREALFQRDEMQPVLAVMGRSRPGREGNFAQWDRLLLQWERATSAHRLFGGSIETLSALLRDEAVPYLEEVEFERLHGVRVIAQISADPARLRPFLSFENARVASEAISQWSLKRYDPLSLFHLAQTSSRIEVVTAVFRSLQDYRDERVTNFLVHQLITGSFNIHLLARRTLLASQDRDHVRAEMGRLVVAGDLFARVAASNILREMQQRPVLEDVPSAIDKQWKTYVTDFFRFSSELAWITDEVRGLVRDWPAIQPIRLVSIGASFGPEVLSLLMFLDSDYLRNPEGWGGLSPWDRVEIVATDIDPVVLAYGARGRFRSHPCLELSDIKLLESVTAHLGIPLDQYFEIDRRQGIYQLRPEWRGLTRTEILDILQPDPFITRFGQPEGILYNMVDCHLGNSNTKAVAAHHVARLTGLFAAVVPCSPITRSLLEMFMTLERQEGVEHLFYPRGELGSPDGARR